MSSSYHRTEEMNGELVLRLMQQQQQQNISPTRVKIKYLESVLCSPGVSNTR
jgi:hypothetical protein